MCRTFFLAFPGDNAALFTAVIEVRSKLIEGNSAPFDLPIRSTNSSSRGGGGDGGGGGGGAGGGAEHNHVQHYHGDDDEDDPYGQNRRVVETAVPSNFFMDYHSLASLA